jgi:hypothetical protein
MPQTLVTISSPQRAIGQEPDVTPWHFVLFFRFLFPSFFSFSFSFGFGFSFFLATTPSSIFPTTP